MQYWVYILTNKIRTVLYVGITNDLQKRVSEHKSKLAEGFTNKYNVTQLVYFESFTNAADAIAAEKRIKGWTRVKKNQLISTINSNWAELYDEILR